MTESKPQISARAEARLFWRIRRQGIANALSQSIRRSRLSRLGILVVMSVVMWGLLFSVSCDALRFVQQVLQDNDAYEATIRAGYGVYFGSLMVMLVVSTGVLLYSSLYRSAETRLLLVTPAREQRIFLHKLQESMLFSSWSFLLLGSPMLVSHGVVESAGWLFYAMLPPLLLAFVCIASSVGALFCLVIVRWLPSHRIQFLVVLGALLVGGASMAGRSMVSEVQADPLTREWFQQMLAGVRVGEYRLLPNGWLSSGLMASVHGGLSDAAARRALWDGAMYLGLMVVCAVVCQQTAVWVAGRIYRTGYRALDSNRSAKRRVSSGKPNPLTPLVAWFLPVKFRLLMQKDLRLFRRDPVQWSQFTVFVVLLLLYFANTHQLSEGRRYASWVHVISFLNVALIGLILASFTTRFVFPAISLEGRRFWILGLLPIRRSSILWAKFLFAMAATLLPGIALVWLSDWLLDVSGPLLLIHLAVGVLACGGLSGIAVGLGARYPDMRQDSPGRIAAGFGGTIALISSMTYVLLLVSLVAAPCYLYFATPGSTGAIPTFPPDLVRLWLIVDSVLAALLAAVATGLPLWVGIRSFQRLEF